MTRRQPSDERGAPQTVGEALRRAAARLSEAGVESPRLDAEVLLAHVLGLSRAGLYVERDRPLTRDESARYHALVERREAREPVAYLVGSRAFYDVELQVDRRVLVPRPETELLVEMALAWGGAQSRRLRMADVGTGSGALAVVLARHLPGAVVATDRSLDALRVAAGNVRRYGLTERVHLVCCDLLSALRGPFDLIVANLPYLPAARLSELAPEVAAYEPHGALFAGAQGLDDIRRLVGQAAEALARPGLLVLEIDQGQGAAVREMALAALPGAAVSVHRDYAGLERVARLERAP